MATLGDIGVSALINIITVFAFLLAFALLRIQPVNERVYFTKWYINGAKKSATRTGNFVGNFINLNFRTYLTFLNWMPNALKMSEEEIINHAGLDSAVFLRIFTLGLKIFIPTTLVAIIIIPVNVSSGTLSFLRKDLVFSNIDKLSISNVPPRSSWFFIHILMEYLLTLWACFLLYKEYDEVASMRFRFLASKRSTVEEFTILVRNVPRVSGQSVSESVEEFFEGNHHGTYNCHKVVYNANKFARLVKKCNNLQNWLDYNQLKLERCPEKRPTKKKGFLGLWGERVDSIDWFKEGIRNLNQRIRTEFERIQSNPKSVLPVAFVMFKSRRGAAVCAETQQSRNPTLWLTSWAPEPRDIYWKNLAIPFVSLRIRKLVVLFMLFSLVFFYMIPITFVQSLANLEGIEKVVPFLKRVIELKFIKSFLQGFLPGLALKIFLSVLPAILLVMSKLEGYISMSKIERLAAGKYYYFMLVNVFLGSIVAGTAFEQLRTFLHQSPTQFPRTIAVSIPMKATFFITYIMVDGWAGIASEILRLKPLVIFHLKNMFLVKTERDRERAMDPKSASFPETIPQLQLYFLLGSVYAVVTPILLPFILIFFAFAYLVFRHQIINVYNQEYESVAAFWPHVHSRIVASLVISHLLLMGLLSTKEAAKSTPLLVVLPILTLAFQQYCKHRFEAAFRKFPIEEAVAKDKLQEAKDPGFYLHDSMLDEYLHPVFKSFQKEGWDDPTIHSKDEHVDSPGSVPTSPVVREVHYAHHYYEYGHDV